MTFRTESRLTIDSSVHEVWAYLADVGRWPEWAPTVLEGRVRAGSPFQPGARGNGTPAPGRRADRHHDVDRGRPRGHHAGGARGHAQRPDSARQRYRNG